MGRGWLVAAAAGLLATAAPGFAQGEDPLVAARAAQAAGQAGRAYELLGPLADTRAGDPEFDYALGLAAIDSRRPSEAIVALQRVLAVQPNNGPARAELARAYAAIGDIDTARAEFDTVVGDPSIPDPVRQRFTRLVRDFDRQIAGGADELTGFFDVEGGWDSNINAATDQTSILLPAFAFLGPAALNGAAVERDEPFVQVQGGLSGSTAIRRQTRAFGSVLGNWREHLRSSFVDQLSGIVTTGVAHTLASRDVLSLAGQAQVFLLDGEGYQSSVGAVGRYTKRLTDGAALSLSAQYFRLNYDNQPLRDADRFAGSVVYTGRTIYAGAGGGREDTRRAGAEHFSFTFANGQVGAEMPVSARVSVQGGASVEYRDHDGADPLFLTGREDVRLDLSLGLRVLLAEHVSVRPRVTYTRNESNLALYDYGRWTAGIGLRFEF